MLMILGYRICSNLIQDLQQCISDLSWRHMLRGSIAWVEAILLDNLVNAVSVNWKPSMSLMQLFHSLAKIYYCHLRNTGRPLLTKEAAVRICRSRKSSRIDYCDGLLMVSPSCLTDRLQRVRNTAAHITPLGYRYDHTSPVLQELLWLPIKNRINSKIPCLAHPCLTCVMHVIYSSYVGHWSWRHLLSHSWNIAESNNLYHCIL